MFVLVVALVSFALAACGRTPAPEQSVAYFQGATKAQQVPLGMPEEIGGGAGQLPEVAVSPVPIGPTPKFEVIAQRTNDRPDDLVTYYVVIDPVVPGNDAFKLAVKQVLGVLTVDNGGPAFSARIFDHGSAAQTEVGYRTNPGLFSDELFRARAVYNGQHLVADYVGGLSAPGEPPSYMLFWFPQSGIDSAGVGEWIGAEVWKPSPAASAPVVTLPDAGPPGPMPAVAPPIEGPEGAPPVVPEDVPAQVTSADVG